MNTFVNNKDFVQFAMATIIYVKVCVMCKMQNSIQLKIYYKGIRKHLVTRCCSLSTHIFLPIFQYWGLVFVITQKFCQQDNQGDSHARICFYIDNEIMKLFPTMDVYDNFPAVFSPKNSPSKMAQAPSTPIPLAHLSFLDPIFFYVSQAGCE